MLQINRKKKTVGLLAIAIATIVLISWNWKFASATGDGGGGIICSAQWIVVDESNNPNCNVLNPTPLNNRNGGPLPHITEATLTLWTANQILVGMNGTMAQLSQFDQSVGVFGLTGGMDATVFVEGCDTRRTMSGSHYMLRIPVNQLNSINAADWRLEFGSALISGNTPIFLGFNNIIFESPNADNSFDLDFYPFYMPGINSLVVEFEIVNSQFQTLATLTLIREGSYLYIVVNDVN